jgi:hypothetical protein
MNLNAERWTVIATKPSHDNSPVIRWRYEPGYNARNVAVGVDTKRLITAHKRVDGGWHLVAKLAKS